MSQVAVPTAKRKRAYKVHSKLLEERGSHGKRVGSKLNLLKTLKIVRGQTSTVRGEKFSHEKNELKCLRGSDAFNRK